MMKTKEKPAILLVDDDRLVLEALRRLLCKEGFTIHQAHSAKEALGHLERHSISVVVSDYAMPGVTGMDFLRQVRQKYPQVLRLLLTGEVGLELACRAAEDGTIFRFFTKPCNVVDLLVTIRQGLYQHFLEEQNQQLTEVIGHPHSEPSATFPSREMQIMYEQIEKVKELDATVLISGESGTGKTTVARQIHQSSPRSAKPFIVVNCAALPRDLIEAELFGYERGAFTGAVTTRLGRAELADGGTLFLDEIGDMPLELQPKLLTFLDNRLVTRLGGKGAQHVNVRVIAATNQNLVEMCQHKLFREDLFFRLNVIAIHLPPLRRRLTDIPTLIESTLRRIARERSCPAFRLTQEAMRHLCEYSWPGNVRELENQLERASALCGNGIIDKHDLNVTIGSFSQNRQSAHEALGIPLTLEEVEKHAIEQALENSQGNRAAAARILGVSEKTVYNKIKRWGISPQRPYSLLVRPA